MIVVTVKTIVVGIAISVAVVAVIATTVVAGVATPLEAAVFAVVIALAEAPVAMVRLVPSKVRSEGADEDLESALTMARVVRSVAEERDG